MSEKPKAKPGRPPTIKPVTITEHIYDTKNIVEFFHRDVLTFKKIFYLLRILNSRNIIFDFKKNLFQIKTEQGVIKIAHNYHCKEEVSIEVDNIFKTMDTIHKTYTSISIIYTESKQLLVKFFDSEIRSDVLSAINSRVKNLDINVDYSEHQLHFELSCSYFKKTITNISTLSDDFTIRQIKGQPLLLTAGDDYQVILQNIPITFNGPNFFTTTCKISNLVQLATGLTGESIMIHAHITKRMIMEIKIIDNISMYFMPRI